ncbi:hypothetical protein CK203_025302 [Vitis vinifera]|uniref:Integrase catalytic domain-containing protein n=1 Tax=Vitis vinifera TaxID=29760 RepID=A0A438IZW3_VITVI|nr:hypothetical protein CK203_025302 [Vitis vinifera]
MPLSSSDKKGSCKSLWTTYGRTYVSHKGIDIIGKISPKSSNGHEFILVAIDYFTKWVEAASYARLTSSGVASFIRSHIICHYGVPLLPVEIEMGSLRVALKQQIPKADWAQARLDQLNLLDERRLRTADHVHAYQRKMARALRSGLSLDYYREGADPDGAAWLMDLDGNRFSEPTNVDQLKSLILLHRLIIDIVFTLGTLSFPSILLPYHPGLRYIPCLKTTLRPWDQMLPSIVPTWTVVDIDDQDFTYDDE